MTATVSLNPDELRALDRHHNGTTIPADQHTLGTILDRIWSGAQWQQLVTAPPARRVGRIPQVMKPTAGRCDYCAHNCTYPPHADHCTCECQCDTVAA